jgi:hypothetical protein
VGTLLKLFRILWQVSGGFDGFYTYFASEGFVYGSSRGNWPSMIDFANRNGLLSSISVGPGMLHSMCKSFLAFSCCNFIGS